MSDNKQILAGPSQNALFDARIYIDGFPIPWKSIGSLVVREYIWQPIPMLELIISDTGIFLEANPITEGSKIDVEVHLNTGSDAIIKNTFTVVGSTISTLNPIRNDLFALTLIALYEPQKYVYPIKNMCYSKMTASEALEKLYKNNKTKVKTKISSQDNMTWYQINQNDNTSIQNIVDRSFCGTGDSMVSFIDRNGEATISSFLTVEKGNSIPLKWSPDKKSDMTPQKEDDINLYMSSFTVKDASPFANMNGVSKTELTYYEVKDGTVKTEYLTPPAFATKYINKSKEIADLSSNNHTRGFRENMHAQYYQSLVNNYIIRGSYLSDYLITNIKPDKRVELMKQVDLNMSGLDGKPNITYNGKYLISGITHHLSSEGTYQMSTMLCRPGINTVAYNRYEPKLKEN